MKPQSKTNINEMNHFTKERTKIVKPKLSNLELKKAQDYEIESLSARSHYKRPNDEQDKKPISLEGLDLYDGPSFAQRMKQ